jgi:hypothetical protein
LAGGQGGGVGGKASGRDPRAEWSRERESFSSLVRVSREAEIERR